MVSVESPRRQRVLARLNGGPPLERMLSGSGQLVEVRSGNLRRGLNVLEFDLADTAIAVRSVTFVHAPWPVRRAGGVRGALLRLLGQR